MRRVLERLPNGALRTGDVVGDLVNLDAQTAVIETRDGAVEVPLALVMAARQAPPSTADDLAVEDAMALGWRAAETAHVGGWLLRANDGVTRRANSVLPRRAPGVPLAEAIAEARAWYAHRGRPLRFQIPTEARRLLDAALAEDGWPAGEDNHVMTARLDRLAAIAAARPDPSPVNVELSDVPDEAWLARWRDGLGLATGARELVLRHPHVVFATVHGDGVAAIGRGTVDGEWLGVSCVEVAPARRRQGLATAVVAALRDWGSAGGARRSHLEVSAANVPAVALYESLGYTVHHDYRYRTDPTTG